jgi:hypothetical protein
MEEPSIQEALIHKGRAQGERDSLLRVGTKRFGPPDKTCLAALQSITDLQRLAKLGERFFKAKSWQELLSASALFDSKETGMEKGGIPWYSGWTHGKYEVLFMLADKKFGPPDEPSIMAFKKILPADIDDFLLRLLDVDSWQELLAILPPKFPQD